MHASLGGKLSADSMSLNAAKMAEVLNIPGVDFVPLLGKPTLYGVHEIKPRCITIELEGDKVPRLQHRIHRLCRDSYAIVIELVFHFVEC